MTKERHGIRCEIPKDWAPRLKWLLNNTSSANKTEVIRRALSIYLALHEQQKDGWSVVLKKDKEEKQFPVN